MSNKQDKKSRKLQKDLDTYIDKRLKEIEKAKEIDKANTLKVYNIFLKSQPLWARLKFAFHLILGRK